MTLEKRPVITKYRSYAHSQFFRVSDKGYDLMSRMQLPMIVRLCFTMKGAHYISITAEKAPREAGTIVWYDAPFASKEKVNEAIALFNKINVGEKIYRRVRKADRVWIKSRDL